MQIWFIKVLIVFLLFVLCMLCYTFGRIAGNKEAADRILSFTKRYFERPPEAKRHEADRSGD